MEITKALIMRLVAVVFSALLNVGACVTAGASDSSDIIYINGEPCGSFCRSWMGIPDPAPVPAYDERLRARGRSKTFPKSAIDRSHALVPTQAMHTPLPRPKPSRKSDVVVSVRRHHKAAHLASVEAQSGVRTQETVSFAGKERPYSASRNGSEISDRNGLSEEATQPTQMSPRPSGSASAEPPERASATAADIRPTKLPDPLADDAAAAATTITNVGTAGVSSSIAMAQPKALPDIVGLASMLSLSPVNSVIPPMTGPATPSPASSEARVAIVMTQIEIASLSDLISQEIAIDARQVNAQDSVRAGLAIVGATNVKLTDQGAKALDRLIAGDVPAAVLALVTPAAAATFPYIAGFRTFRVPIPK